MPTPEDPNERLYATLDRLAEQLYVQNELLAELYRIVHPGQARKPTSTFEVSKDVPNNKDVPNSALTNAAHKPSRTTIIELPDLPVKRLKNT